MIRQAIAVMMDGTWEEIAPANRKDFQLDELQAIVGGPIEVIQPEHMGDTLMIISEDAKIIGQPVNGLATQLWQWQAEPGSMRMTDAVCGNVVICHRNQVE